jgi:hypothetical protein
VIFGVAGDGHAYSKGRGGGALGHCFGRVVRSFGVHIGTQIVQQGFGGWFAEEHYVIYFAQRGHQTGPSVFVENRTARAFQISDAGVVIYPNHQNIALGSRGLKISHVANVQHIEAAVGKDHALSALLVCGK